MATSSRRARTAARSTPAPAAAAPAANESFNARRLELQYIPIDDIVPYDWNPRDNQDAVQSVANSIRLTQGFAMPVVIDANNVLVAGHTRVEAAKTLGMLEVPAVRLAHLTPEQINAFRVVDNKVASLAKWDFDLLAGELGKLADSGIEFTDFGWSQGELDCMSQIVAADCLSTAQVTQVATVATEEATRAQGTRAPTRARGVIGEFVFFVDMPVYRPWSNGIRELCNFDEEAIAAELKRRLGITG